MDGFSSWIDSNWFNIIQTVGIMGSLLMTAAAANRDSKAREVENLLTLNGQHRELWSGLIHQTELQRILKSDADVLNIPVTAAEREFLNLVFVHFQTGWTIAKSGALITLEEMKSDVREFFSLPLPRAVWEKTKSFRNRQFVKFIQVALK